MAQTCNLPISEFRPLRADYTVGFQSILAYRVTLCLQNKTQLRFSCNFLEPLRNPNSRFGQYFIHPLQTQSPQTRAESRQAIRRAEGSSNCRSRKPFSRKQPSPHSHLPVSSVKRHRHPRKREGCANTQHPTWASRPPEHQAWPEAPGLLRP